MILDPRQNVMLLLALWIGAHVLLLYWLKVI
jgi:hypothetical protein